MTVAWMVLMVVGGLVSLAASVWLLVTAFRESAVWGLASLFIPLVVLIFAVKFWNEAKLPFFGCLAGSILSLFGAVGYSMTSVNVGIEEYADLGERVAWEAPMVDSVASAEVESAGGVYPGSEEGWPELDQGLDEVDEDVAPSAELRNLNDEEGLEVLDDPGDPPPPRRPHRDGKLVPLSKLGSLQGERVVLLLTSLERVSAYVVSVDGDSVQLRHRVGGGSVTYTIDFDIIKEVRSRRAP